MNDEGGGVYTIGEGEGIIPGFFIQEVYRPELGLEFFGNMT